MSSWDEVVDAAEAHRRLASAPPLELLGSSGPPESPLDRFVYARALSLLGRDSEAAKLLGDLAAEHEGDRSIRLALIMAEARAGIRDPIAVANEVWDRADEYPEPAVARQSAAALAVSKTRHGTAAHRFALDRLGASVEETLRTHPDDLSALALGALADGDRRRVGPARERLDRLRNLGMPPWPWVWSVDALVAGRGHQERRRVASWRRAEELLGRRPRWVRYWLTRSLSLAAVVVLVIWFAAIATDDLFLLGLSLVAYAPIPIVSAMGGAPWTRMAWAAAGGASLVGGFLLFRVYG